MNDNPPEEACQPTTARDVTCSAETENGSQRARREMTPEEMVAALKDVLISEGGVLWTFSAAKIKEVITALESRYDHSDPCTNEDCPCFAAGWEARMETRDAFFAAKRARKSAKGGME